MLYLFFVVGANLWVLFVSNIYIIFYNILCKWMS